MKNNRWWDIKSRVWGGWTLQTESCAFHFLEIFHLVEIFAINEWKLKRSILNRLKYKKIKLWSNSLLEHFSYVTFLKTIVINVNVNVFLMRSIKKHCLNKSNFVFLKLWWRKLLKVAAFVIFSSSIIALLETHQRFKGHFLNEIARFL